MAVDYRILDVNPAYETHTEILKDQAIGALASELYGSESPPFLEVYSRVTETRVPEKFDVYFEPMDKFFRISVFSPKEGQFATVFENITS